MGIFAHVTMDIFAHSGLDGHWLYHDTILYLSEHCFLPWAPHLLWIPFWFLVFFAHPSHNYCYRYVLCPFGCLPAYPVRRKSSWEQRILVLGCYNTTPEVEWLHQHFCLWALKAVKFKIKALADSVPGEGSLPGLQMAVFMLCSHIVERGQDLWCAFLFIMGGPSEPHLT